MSAQRAVHGEQWRVWGDIGHHSEYSVLMERDQQDQDP